VLLSIDLTVPCYCQELGNHFTTSGPFGLIASPTEEDDDGVLPSMAQEMLEVAAANNNNNNSNDDETTTFVTAARGHQAMSPIVNIQDDKMISWLQDPLNRKR
jgi:hypothetical protein